MDGLHPNFIMPCVVICSQLSPKSACWEGQRCNSARFGIHRTYPGSCWQCSHSSWSLLIQKPVTTQGVCTLVCDPVKRLGKGERLHGGVSIPPASVSALPHLPHLCKRKRFWGSWLPCINSASAVMGLCFTARCLGAERQQKLME